VATGLRLFSISIAYCCEHGYVGFMKAEYFHKHLGDYSFSRNLLEENVNCVCYSYALNVAATD
jgi:hypothetical protein